MTDGEARPRSHRLRWHAWAAATVILVVATPIVVAGSYRAAGFRRFDAEVARERARGLATTLDDLIALAPPVDAARQMRWQAAMLRLYAARVDQLGLADVDVAELADGHGLPEPVRRDREAAAAVMADVRALLREGPVVASGFGWMREHFASGDRSLAAVASLPLPNLLATRIAATWLEIDAVAGADPSAALDDLDCLAAALARPTTLIDAMIAIAVARIRDDTYLRCAVLGRLPATRRDRWCGERATFLIAIADGMRGERVLDNTAIVDTARRLGLSVDGARVLGLGGAIDLRTRLGWYLWTGGGGARIRAIEAQYEERWRGLRPDAPQPIARGVQLGLAASSDPNGVETGITGWESMTRHRLMRLAARVLAAESPPDSNAAFAAGLAGDAQLATGPDDAALRYERLDARSFRVTVDPASPAPDFADVARVRSQSKAGAPPTLAGKPPRRVPLILDRAAVEVVLPRVAKPRP